jgi:G:T/U-mismatch repair DNA glycosylase
MEFFYPNWINDMWRIMGLLFFADKHHFEIKGHKTFDRERIIEFCTTKGIALYDTATEVRRLKDNASDKFLEIVTPTNIDSLIAQLPDATAIVTTGQKATDIIIERFGCSEPQIGSKTDIIIGEHTIHFWRMPSSSRAYPLAIDKKAAHYATMLRAEGLL